MRVSNSGSKINEQMHNFINILFQCQTHKVVLINANPGLDHTGFGYLGLGLVKTTHSVSDKKLLNSYASLNFFNVKKEQKV